MNVLIAVMLLAIVASLGRALFLMSAGPQESNSMVNALTIRIALSIALFILLMVGNHFGWIQPHGM